MRTTLRAALAFGAALTLAACSGDSGTTPENPLPAGTFEATITGDYNATAKGQAAEVGMENTTDPDGVLELLDARDSSHVTELTIFFGPRPVAPGTYTLSQQYSTSTVSGEFRHFDARLDQDYAYLQRLSGTVTIQSVSGTTVVGTLNVEKTGSDPDTGEPFNVHYAGRFTAVDPF